MLGKFWRISLKFHDGSLSLQTVLDFFFNTTGSSACRLYSNPTNYGEKGDFCIDNVNSLSFQFLI